MDYRDHASERQRPSLLRNALSLVGTIALFVAITWGLRLFVLQPYEIPSGSMEETIQVGDMLFSEKISYYVGEPAYGDIVTFADPEIPSRTLIKRVIATGGQTVDLVDGNVVVDGKVLVEPYTDGKPSYPLTPAYGTSLIYPYTVPEGYLWVMGDNRTNSQDSRYFGAVDSKSVTGKAFFVYWPLDHLGPLMS